MLVSIKKGQSMLEYTLLLGALIVIIVGVLFSGGGIGGKVGGGIKGAFEKAGTAVEDATSNLDSKVFN